MHLPKSMECTTPKMNPKVNDGLWMIMMSHCKFLLSKKFTSLVSDVDNGRGYACVEAGNIWKILVFSSQFYCKPKTALKKYSLYKKRKKNSKSTLEGK